MVVTVNVPAVPRVNVVASALVIVGALAAATVSVKVWVASGAVPLAAVIVSVVEPAVPVSGVLARVAVPSRLSTNVTPVGRVPVWSRSAPGSGFRWSSP